VGGLVAIPLTSLVSTMSRWRGAAVVCSGGLLYLALLVLAIDRVVLASDERRWFHEIVRQRWAWCKSTHRRLLDLAVLRSA
jgi:hypothetical protein